MSLDNPLGGTVRGVNANLVETTGEGVLPLTATRRRGLLLSVLV